MPNLLHLPLPELFALLAAIAFAAGLNVYATVAALGLLARFGHVPLPPALELLETWPVIAASTILFTIEFFADKIPAFDLIWSALHLHPHPRRRTPGLRSHPPTNPSPATPGRSPRCSHSPSRPRRQNRPPRRRNPKPRALLQHHPKPSRRRRGHSPNLAGHKPSLRGRHDSASPGSSNSPASPSSNPSHAQAVSRSRRRTGGTSNVGQTQL
jgi:hypothetical protein